MNYKFNFIILVINMLVDMFFTTRLYSQNESIQNPYNMHDSWIEYVNDSFDKYNNEEDINSEIERLSELINKPILINFCGKADLEALPFLSDQQIESLLFYVHVYGPFKSLHELILVDYFDAQTIDLILPFLSLETPPKASNRSFHNLFENPKVSLLMRCDTAFPKKKGYVDKSDSLYLTSPEKYYQGIPLYSSLRVKMSRYKRFEIGLTAERDAGEIGMDFWSGYLRLYDLGCVRQLVVGNYKLRYGAGLLLNNGFSMGKSAVGAETLIRSAVISPHASIDEYTYLQGCAAELAFKRFRLYPFWSMRRYDARLVGDTIRTIDRTGLHRTMASDTLRRQAHVISYGARLAYRGSCYELGLSGVIDRFSHPYFPTLRDYNRYDFRGQQNGGISIDYRLRKGPFAMAGEMALSDAHRLATIHAFSFTPTSNVQLHLLYRYYAKSYALWMAKSYAEGSKVQDEQGISIYANWQWLRHFYSEIGIDFFEYAWLRMGLDRPSWGYDLRFKQRYQHADNWSLVASYRLKNKEKNYTLLLADDPLIGTYQRHSFGVEYTAAVASFFLLRGGIDGVSYRFHTQERSMGLLFFQRMGYRCAVWPLQLDLGFALFDTDDTMARVYLSEKNLLYAFGFPSFYGQGTRASFVLQLDLSAICRVSMKYAQTHYFDRTSMGSGMEMICANQKHELSVQVRFQF